MAALPPTFCSSCLISLLLIDVTRLGDVRSPCPLRESIIFWFGKTVICAFCFAGQIMKTCAPRPQAAGTAAAALEAQETEAKIAADTDNEVQ